jgi:hypothetical protein
VSQSIRRHKAAGKKMDNSAYPKHGKIFRPLYRADFAVFGNNDGPKAFGGSTDNGIRKRYTIKAFQAGAFPIDRMADGFDNLNGKISNFLQQDTL